MYKYVSTEYDCYFSDTLYLPNAVLIRNGDACEIDAELLNTPFLQQLIALEALIVVKSDITPKEATTDIVVESDVKETQVQSKRKSKVND